MNLAAEKRNKSGQQMTKMNLQKNKTKQNKGKYFNFFMANNH